MGESTQGYGGAALLQGGAAPVFTSSELTQAQYDYFVRATAALSIGKDLELVPIEDLLMTADFRADVRRELRNRERLLAGVNYRMQFFRGAA